MMLYKYNKINIKKSKIKNQKSKIKLEIWVQI